MCTVSVVPVPAPGAGLRVAFNRDESPARPTALPPVEKRFRGRRALLPIDPRGAGTWIAATDDGIVLALLNRNPPGPGPAPRGRAGRPSRGGIIPALLAAETFEGMIGRALAIDPREYPPFRILLVRAGAGVVVDHHPGRMRARRFDPSTPRMLASSGLGDLRATRTRRALFTRLIARSPSLLSAQAAFHRSARPDRPHLGVCVEGTRARTVSHTLIDLGPRATRMIYFAEWPPRAGAPDPVVRWIPAREAGARNLREAS